MTFPRVLWFNIVFYSGQAVEPDPYFIARAYHVARTLPMANVPYTKLQYGNTIFEIYKKQ